ncbi:MAG: hypothetical protein EOP50_18995 [Sphingobacteriales bacterium]|nr:MAG: hypothetical protein EOP50_18995 [Sphingobacteriales bacterium]
MSQSTFTPEDSLALIQTMIRKTRSGLGENRFYFLFWGWVVFAALLTEYVLKVLLGVERHYHVWWVIVPAVLITILYSRRHRERSGVSSYVGESMGYLWMGVGISFFVMSILVSAIPQGYNYLFPFYILFYGLGTFISGRLLRFRPLIIGGIVNWVLAIACIYVPYDTQMLLTALAILASYIIPGHLLGRAKTETV